MYADNIKFICFHLKQYQHTELQDLWLAPVKKAADNLNN